MPTPPKPKPPTKQEAEALAEAIRKQTQRPAAMPHDTGWDVP